MKDVFRILDMRRLHIFCQIARDHSFRAAALHLGISQPALSRHVQALEDELGVILFHRGGRATTLTEAGMLLYERSMPALKNLAETRNLVEAMGMHPVGLVTLAVLTTFSMAFLPRLLDRMRTSFPQIQVRVTEGTSRYVKDCLARNYADVGVIITGRPSKRFITEDLLTEEFHLVSGRPMPWVDEEPLPFSFLADLPVVLPLHLDGTRPLLDETAAKAGFRFKPYIEVDSPHLIKQILLSNEVYAILPKSSFLADLRNGSLWSVSLTPAPARTIATATLRGEPLSAAARLVAHEIRCLVSEDGADR